jgi:histidine triad (HIT) family protein
MPTVFTQIIEGQIPGEFVWRDELAVGFMSINPITRGHALIVPIAEVDHWLDLDPDLNRHLASVAHEIGNAQQRAFEPDRIGLMIAGFEVPHTHLHVLPINGLGDLSFANAATEPDFADIAAAASQIRAHL